MLFLTFRVIIALVVIELTNLKFVERRKYILF
jgi:hypothetical protein